MNSEIKLRIAAMRQWLTVGADRNPEAAEQVELFDEICRNYKRYEWLRSRDIDLATTQAGLFVGMTSGRGEGGQVLNFEDADKAIDYAIMREATNA